LALATASLVGALVDRTYFLHHHHSSAIPSRATPTPAARIHLRILRSTCGNSYAPTPFRAALPSNFRIHTCAARRRAAHTRVPAALLLTRMRDRAPARRADRLPPHPPPATPHPAARDVWRMRARFTTMVTAALTFPRAAATPSAQLRPPAGLEREDEHYRHGFAGRQTTFRTCTILVLCLQPRRCAFRTLAASSTIRLWAVRWWDAHGFCVRIRGPQLLLSALPRSNLSFPHVCRAARHNMAGSVAGETSRGARRTAPHASALPTPFAAVTQRYHYRGRWCARHLPPAPDASRTPSGLLTPDPRLPRGIGNALLVSVPLHPSLLPTFIAGIPILSMPLLY